MTVLQTPAAAWPAIAVLAGAVVRGAFKRRPAHQHIDLHACANLITVSGGAEVSELEAIEEIGSDLLEIRRLEPVAFLAMKRLVYGRLIGLRKAARRRARRTRANCQAAVLPFAR